MNPKETLHDLYSNPTKIQSAVLQDIEIAGGGVIPTSNNTCSILTEHMSAISSGLVSGFLATISAENPLRAQQINELYKHISDYEHVGIYATPATTKVEFIRLLDELVTTGYRYNPNDPVSVALFTERDIDQNHVIHYIPAHSVFTIGGYNFANRYPIRIVVIPATEDAAGRIASVSYDNLETDPAHPLHDYHVEYRIDQDAAGAGTLLSLLLDLEQYELNTVISTLHTEAQYVDSYSYVDSLYQVRVFTDREYPNMDQPIKTIDGLVWTELHQVMDSNVYDPGKDEVPYVVVQPMVSKNMVNVKIPQCFFTNEQLGGRIRVELYTTKGKIKFVLPDINSRHVDAVFSTLGAPTDVATSSLRSSVSLTIYALAEVVSGGTGAIGIDELKNRIVNRRSDDAVIANPGELKEYLASKGFDYKRFKDGLTDRIYICYRNTVDILGRPFSMGSINTVLTHTAIHESDSIVEHFEPNHSVIIPPGSIFKHEPTLNIVNPINSSVLGTDILEVIQTLNTADYTTPLFHTQIMERGGSYLTTTYNFFNPSCSKLNVKYFHATNDQVFIDNLDLVSVPVYKDNPVEDTVELDLSRCGFRLRLYVGSTVEMENVSVVFTINGTVFSTGVIAMEEVSKAVTLDIFFVTNLNINEKGKFELDLVQTVQYLGTDTQLVIYTPPEYQWTSMNHNGMDLEAMDIRVTSNTSSDTVAGERPFGSYYINMNFGERMDQIFNLSEVRAKPKVYERYLENVIARAEFPTYAATKDLYRYDTTVNSSNWVSVTQSYELVNKHVIHDILYEVSNPITVAYTEAIIAALPEEARLVIPYEPGAHANDTLSQYPIVERVIDATDAKYLVATKVVDTTRVISDITFYDGVVTRPDWIELDPEDSTLSFQYVLPKYKHVAGEVILDEQGNPQVSKEREFIFETTIPQIEVKEVPELVSGIVDNSMLIVDNLKPIRDLIIASCSEVEALSSRLLSNTDVYFSPKTSIGTVLHGNKQIPINMELAFTVFVKAASMMTEANKQEIREAIALIVYKTLNNRVFSQISVAEKVKGLYPTIIDSIDVNGINGDSSVQTITHAENDVTFGIATRLAQNENGIYKFKKIDVEFKTLNVGE